MSNISKIIYDSTYITVKLPPKLNKLLTESSVKSKRSKIKEVLIRLEKSLIDEQSVESLHKNTVLGLNVTVRK